MWDLTLPGYKYLGPGNKLNKGKPNNRNDYLSYLHDIGYDSLEYAKRNPYSQWSDADDKILRDYELTDYGGWLGKGYFAIKKAATILGKRGESGQSLRGAGKYPGIEPLDEARKRLKLNDNTWLPTFEGRQSLSNLAAMGDTNGNSGQGSGNEAGLKETPVDDPYIVFRGPPDYTFASLPYVEDRMTFDNQWYSRDHIFRMTSPYDCSQANNTIDANIGGGVMKINPESADGTAQSARWWNFYSGLYTYYHVVSCQYTIFVENFGMEPIWVYSMFYNDDQPNPLATNQDMQLWKGCRYHYLDRRAIAVLPSGSAQTDGEQVDNSINTETGNETASAGNYQSGNMVASMGQSKIQFGGEYKTGQFRREIRLDSSVENWTQTNTNPLLPEKLMVRVKPYNEAVKTNSALSAGDTLHYRLRVHLNYLVEFKELPPNIRYPVQRQPLTVTIAADPLSDS